jgi:pimeloyl-ACP methyl ester carboxylesterase
MIRGHDTSNPVVLYLAGGPGGSELGAMRNHLPALEEYFTVATLDQRGTGTSYPALDPSDTYTLESALADVTATVSYLRDRFGQERVVLLGQSWGTLLGVLAVHRDPALYSAFVGTGQMVSPVETDRIFYADTLSWARRGGMTGLATELEKIGPPPYSSMLDYETALSSEHEVYPYDHTGNSEGEGGFSENFLVPEYSLVDQVHLLAGFMDTFGTLYPRIQDVDLRRDASSLEVPVFFVQGAHEARGRAQPFEEWYSTLVAPRKSLTVLDSSGHRPLFEQPEDFVEIMSTLVRPAVLGR